MCDSQNKWKLLERYDSLDISNKFEVQISLIQPPDGPSHISLRKFAKYLTSDERKRGLTEDEAFFRPMKEGVIIPACKFNELLREIQHTINSAGAGSCSSIRLFSQQRLSEIRLNVINDSTHNTAPLLTIEKWAQLRNADRTNTGIQTFYPTTKISIPVRCLKKYLIAAENRFETPMTH